MSTIDLSKIKRTQSKHFIKESISASTKSELESKLAELTAKIPGNMVNCRISVEGLIYEPSQWFNEKGESIPAPARE
jgi:hypothetical protein